MSYDLILKRPSGGAANHDEVLCALMKLPALSQTEILPADPLDEDEALDFVSDFCLDGGEKEYRSFCARRGCAEDDAEAALAFSVEQLGIDLVSVHIPAGSPVEPVLRVLIDYARANRLVVEDPQRGVDVD